MVDLNFEDLKHWIINETSIQKEFVFKDFKRAVGFMVMISIEAEEINHHPEIHNLFNKVKITLSTHDIGGLSELDLKLAKAIDSIYFDANQSPY